LLKWPVVTGRSPRKFTRLPMEVGIVGRNFTFIRSTCAFFLAPVADSKRPEAFLRHSFPLESALLLHHRVQLREGSGYNASSCCCTAFTSPQRGLPPLFDLLYGLRDRATAVVQRDGLLLLVRDRGFRRFSLPGGGVRQGENPDDAAVRELEEETGLKATSVTTLPQCLTTDVFNTYLVFLISARGELHVDPVELSEATWWDGKGRLPLFGYVRHIIAQLHWPN